MKTFAARILGYPISSIFLFITVLISTQRFTLSPLNTLCCIPIFILSLSYFNSDRKKSIACLLIALFISVDNGADVYTVTPGIIRYVLYCFALFIMIYKNKFSKKNIMFFITGLLPMLILTLLNVKALVLANFQQNVLILLIAGIALCIHKKSLWKFECDTNLLSQALIAYMIGEVINIFCFFNFSTFGYLNYSSTKSLIVFPFLYILHKNKFLVTKTLYFCLTFIVATFFVTRLIILSLVLVLLIFGLKKFFKLRLRYFVGILGILLVCSNIPISEQFLGNYKLGKTLIKMSKKVTIKDAIQVTDPIRYGEFEIFINRNWFNIIFGNGLGSSLNDRNGYLRFVGIDDTAFSNAEINSNTFYNFHDIWTDVGIRTGIWPLIFIFLILVLDIKPLGQNRSAFAATLIVLLFCQFFSTPGLINIAFFTLFYRKERSLPS